jgi:hypothetical protein
VEEELEDHLEDKVSMVVIQFLVQLHLLVVAVVDVFNGPPGGWWIWRWFRWRWRWKTTGSGGAGNTPPTVLLKEILVVQVLMDLLVVEAEELQKQG